jgi:NitT/TauT family transport system permease protein
MRFARILFTFLAGTTLWELASSLSGHNNFPHLWDVFGDMQDLIFTQKFWVDFLYTLSITGAGLLIGIISSFLIIIVLRKFTFIHASFMKTSYFFVSIPSVVFLPLLISVMGANLFTAILIVTLVVFLRMIKFVDNGLNNISNNLKDLLNIYEVPFGYKASHVYLPSIFKSLSTGFKFTSTIAFGTVIAAGLAVGTPGFGSSLLIAETSANIQRVFSYVFVSGFTGILLHNMSFKIR